MTERTKSTERAAGGVGESPPRPDGVLKVRGEFAYASDLWMDGMLWGATLRSPYSPRPDRRPRHRPGAGSVADRPGAGAAGGVGLGAMAFLGAAVRPGISYLLDLLGFPELVAGARLVITGEGSLDRQSLRGKAPVGVARAARRAGVPVVAVSGRRDLTGEQLREAGFRDAYARTDIEPDPGRCMAEAGPLLEKLAAEIPP